MTIKTDGKIAQILKVRINSSSVDEVLRQILSFVANSSLRKVVFTPNPEFLVAASSDPAFRQVLNKSDINLPDGYGLIVLSKIIGQPLKERITGADLAERLLEEGNKRKWRVGISGARRGVLAESEELVRRLKSLYPKLELYNLDSPRFQVSKLKFDLILACHGMKKQEYWIMENKKKISAKVFIGVGGALDFLTGFTRRAPQWMRQIGLEWFWRLLWRPSHIRRVFNAVVVFPFLVIKEKWLS